MTNPNQSMTNPNPADYTQYIGYEIHYETISGVCVDTILDKCRAELLNDGIIKIRRSSFKAFAEIRSLDIDVLRQIFGTNVRKYKNCILVGKNKLSLNTEVEITKCRLR